MDRGSDALRAIARLCAATTAWCLAKRSGALGLTPGFLNTEMPEAIAERPAARGHSSTAIVSQLSHANGGRA